MPGYANMISGCNAGSVYLGIVCHKSDYTQEQNFCQSFMKLFLSVFVILCKFPKEFPVLDVKLGLTVEGDVQMVVGKLGDAAATGCACQETQLH